MFVSCEVFGGRLSGEWGCLLEFSNGSGKFASVHVEVTFRSITGIPVYVIQEPLGDNDNSVILILLSAKVYTPSC